MNKSNFWEPKVNQLICAVDQFLDQNPSGQKIAAFDADGTCWFNDVGRDFYLYQCEHCFKDIWKWEDYIQREKENVEESLWWLAEINHQVSTEELISQAQAALSGPGANLQVIPSQAQLISFLHKKGVEVFIVTASVKWSVVPAAQLLGIDEDHVLGVTTVLDQDSRLTLDRHEPITWRDGKPLALLNATKGVPPFLCSGNTMSDHPLLESATDFRVSINSVNEQDSIFDSEQNLKKVSQSRNWLHFDYLTQE